jgi:hypothetical protein
MDKKILNLILLLFVVLPYLTLAQDQSYFFNPFQFGVKTVKEVRNEIIDSTFLGKVREKAAELLNRAYATTSVFAVSGESIISNNSDLDVNQAVRETYGNWYLLLTKAADEVIKTDPTERNRLAQILRLNNPDDLLDFSVFNVKIESGRLAAIYIGPSTQQGTLPQVSYCEQGVVQCTLWLLTLILRFFYTLALFLAVIFLIWAGILYITKPSEASNIHSRFYYGLLGVIVAVLAFSFVKALESGLSGSTLVSVNQQNQNQNQNQGQNQQSNRQRNNIIIDQNSIGFNNNNIGFIAYTNGGTCNLNVNVYNFRTRDIISSRNNITITNNIQNFNIGILNIQGGDNLRLYFRSDNCNLNLSEYTVNIPREKVAIVLNNVNIKIYGSRTFKVNINTGDLNSFLRSIFENLITGMGDYYLYDQPFYIRFEYGFQNPPSSDGNCSLTLSFKAANAINLNINNNNQVISAQWRQFTRSYSFNLPYERNKNSKTIQMSLSLPQNTFHQVEYSILDIKNCSSSFNLPLTRNISIEH